MSEQMTYQMLERNIVYKPLVWTFFGRAHEGAQEALSFICKRVARKRGCHSDSVRKKLDAAISVCIARRAARMSLACFPARSADGLLDFMEHFNEDIWDRRHHWIWGSWVTSLMGIVAPMGRPLARAPALFFLC